MRWLHFSYFLILSDLFFLIIDAGPKLTPDDLPDKNLFMLLELVKLGLIKLLDKLLEEDLIWVLKVRR